MSSWCGMGDSGAGFCASAAERCSAVLLSDKIVDNALCFFVRLYPMNTYRGLWLITFFTPARQG